ncbi:B12-binding domain-containing radical SAM protein [Candidatus Omnitrophota bacterium]
MKKIAFISPIGSWSKNKKLLKIWYGDSGAKAYLDSLTGIGTGLLILAALTPPNIKIKFIDEKHEKIDFDKKYDLVAITAMTQQATRAYEIADNFRKNNITVILGGIHVTSIPEEAINHANSIVIGEAENLWPKVIKDLLSGKLKRIYRSSEYVDLEKSPSPRFNLLKPKNYKVIWLQTTRGCPRGCEFCVATKIYGSKVRRKTIDQVVNEIIQVKSIWPRFKLGFADDNLFLDRSYARRLVDELIKLDVRWFGQTDVSIAEDVEMLRKLKKSNCMSLFIGFESISKISLSKADKFDWKSKQIKKYPEAIKNIQSFGIGIVGSFIVGFDEDNYTIFDALSNFIIENNIYASQITALTPLPGTKIRERLKKENRILSTKWDNYTFTNINFIPAKMTPKELEEGLEMVYKKIYSNDIVLRKNMLFKEIYKGTKKIEKVAL